MPITTCPYCHLMYDDSSSADSRKHNRRHRKYHEAETELGWLPKAYEVQEALKSRAHEKLRSSDSDQQYSGALDLLHAHFDRSLEASIDRDDWRRHPTFSEYVAMMDYHPEIVPRNVMARLHAEYGRDSETIPIGESYWRPPRSNARKRQKQRQST